MWFEVFRNVVNWLIAASGLFMWVIFIPQYRLLLKVKDSKSISFATNGMSWVLQALIVIQAMIYRNWSLLFVTGVSLFCLSILCVMILYYRKFPGGK